MHLVHLLPYYAPAWVFGGVVRAAYGLTQAQAAAGHSVTVVTTDAGLARREAPAEEMLGAIRVVRCPNRWPVLRRYNLSSPAGLSGALEAVLPRADLLHVHEFRTMENLAALPLARRYGVPVVISPHGTLGYGAGRAIIKRGWDALLGRRLAAGIDLVAALTDDEANEARALWGRFGLMPSVAVVPNGVNPAEFRALPAREAFRQAWGIPPDAPLVLFLGRLHSRKGVHHLLDALHALPDAWLAVVGPDEGALAALQAQARGLDVTRRVVFAGMLTGEEKLAALAGADVLALPAVGEGLPMVVLEALAAGLPVAISDECHLPEVIEAGAGVRLAPLAG
ncbi:MAG: glycosyltransferase, partial [Anaerolineae bacterium]|nr:glycosyltransferase [Anaerolineae bacterium]